MNLNQIKKIDVNDSEELKAALENINSSNDRAGLISTASNVYDIALQIVDGGTSLIAYWALCASIARTFFTLTSNVEGVEEVTSSDVINIFVKTLKTIDKTDEVYFAYMNDMRKWSKLIINEMSIESRAKFYALDKVISESINSTLFLSLYKNIDKENNKVIVLANAYYSIIKNKI